MLEAGVEPRFIRQITLELIKVRYTALSGTLRAQFIHGSLLAIRWTLRSRLAREIHFENDNS